MVFFRKELQLLVRYKRTYNFNSRDTAFICVCRALYECYQTMEGNAGVEVRGQASGDRLLIIKHLLSIEKIFIGTLSSNLEYAGDTVITTDILISFSLFRFGIYNAHRRKVM